ncbi:MAG: hypothetical protein MUF00_11225 [Gemmatimonadaceae bacterium]|nr:hypothetical protein [Gemmatimonadaceae bacterium]
MSTRSVVHHRATLRRFLVAPLLLALTLPPAHAQRRAAATPSTAALDPDRLSQLTFRHIGPEGNRITSVAGVQGDPTTYYAGAASGGLWKSTDNGIHWAPITDKLPAHSIGSVAVAPSDPNVVWIGTGEPFIRSHISVGWGMWKSTDAGKTWTKQGLDATGRISRIAIHPTNPEIVYVASLGHAYGPQKERGIYRTMDGGKTWDQVLFVNDSTGASDLIMDPNNPRILYAGFWQIEIHTWGRTSGGAGSGIWKSTDAGATWTRLKGPGFPTRHVGKIGLGMSKANSNRLFALVETGDGVPAINQAETDAGRLFRSDDAGATWQVVSYDRQVAGRTHYYNRMGVTADNADEAYFLTANWTKTLDGGKTMIDPPFTEVPGGDHHDIWFDQTDGNRFAVSHDGGVSITTNRGKTWNRVALPVAQMYHVTVDNAVPYNVLGNRQDGPSARGPSNSRFASFFGGGIPRQSWNTVGGGESGWATPDPEDPNIVWSSASGFGSVGGIVTRWDARTGHAQNLEVWPQATIGWAADSLKCRFVWTFPLTISPHDRNTVYVGSQHVHVTTNGGMTWRELSPDLTRNDKSRQVRSGGLTPDNIGVEYAGVVFAIAESRLTKGLIWAGTNDGKVQLTRDGGRTWTDLTANLRGMPEWGTISNIEPSRFDAGTAYLSVDAHQANNRDPWIYRTTDYGQTWTLITSGIEKTPLSYVHVVREDPVRRGMLYAGTENGLYVSWNDGASWQSLQNNLPHSPVYWIAVQEHYNDLVLATYGRGFWILDDLTPLRQLDDAITNADAHLFTPRFAYRMRQIEAPFFDFEDPNLGTNPPDGAVLHYWSKAESKDSVSIDVLDGAGRVVRTLKHVPKAGINRLWWDLTVTPTREPRLRSAPQFSPWLNPSAEGRVAPGIQRFAYTVPPGTYQVRLTHGGRTFTQPLEIRRDPNTPATANDIAQQVAMAQRVHADVDSTVAMINAVELARQQLASLRAALATDSTMKDLVAATDSMETKLHAFQATLFQTRVTGRGQDQIRWPFRLAEQLVYLGQTVAGNADFAPTDQHREVQALLGAQVKERQGAFRKLMNEELAAYRARVRARSPSSVVM